MLAQSFAGIGWETPRILDATRDVPDFYFDRVAQVHMAGWTRGRVALVGDAGYSPSPVTGLGTSLAIVGAYVLAGEVAEADGEWARAFARDEAQIRAYVKQGQELPPGGLEGMLPRTRAAMWLRNQSTRSMTRWPVRNLVASRFQRADAIRLKESSLTGRDLAVGTNARKTLF
jgi:2-polyprenyl-6-methoxyphenol hydroxylase-like FAD-dependent oxidoreductase